MKEEIDLLRGLHSALPCYFFPLSWHKLLSRSLAATHSSCRDKSLFCVKPPQLNQCHATARHSCIIHFIHIKDLLRSETVQHLGIIHFSPRNNKRKRVVLHLVVLEATDDSSGGCWCLVDKRFVAVTGQKKNGVFFA